MIKVIVLSDNREGATGLGTEHGLSVYVETDNHKLLLDTGASDLFLRNAQILDVDLSAVDYVFISHGHRDHIGGLPYFLQVNDKAQIILSPFAVARRFVSKQNGWHDISLDFDLSNYANRLLLVEGALQIGVEIRIFSNVSTRFKRPIANKLLFARNKVGRLISDTFTHELIFTLTIHDEIFVFSGCAHNGLLNIIETVTLKCGQPPHWVMGGFHLLDPIKDAFFESELEIIAIADYLNNNYPATQFFTSHCTGNNILRVMNDRMKSQVTPFHSGYAFLETD